MAETLQNLTTPLLSGFDNLVSISVEPRGVKPVGNAEEWGGIAGKIRQKEISETNPLTMSKRDKPLEYFSVSKDRKVDFSPPPLANRRPNQRAGNCACRTLPATRGDNVR
jgi:hypothetical protein